MKADPARSILVLTLGAGACALTPGNAAAQTSAPQIAQSTKPSVELDEIVVTAQKREQGIQSVGMSIQAASGDELTKLGIKDTSDLEKLVPGFSATPNITGAPVFTIRGVGFQDLSLAANPTVSIYNDQVPLPFSIESIGSTLDLQRVEVLKGPQGTLFGENATGGAINYVANKPTSHFEDGADVSYGRFNTVDAQGYVSGPLTETLSARLAIRTLQGDGWQKSYTRDANLGSPDLTSGRLSLQWQPNSRLTALVTLSGFLDRSQTPAPQFDGIKVLNSNSTLPAGLLAYTIAPDNDRAADWSPCINDSPLNTHCVSYRRDNKSHIESLRLDYALNDDVTLTSLTADERFTQYQPTDSDGTIYQDFEGINAGHLSTFFQELRLSGKFRGKGSWITGLNYQDDNTAENQLYTFAQSSSGAVLGLPIVGNGVAIADRTHTYAMFAHADYPVIERLTVEAGLRLTRSDQTFAGCERDNGNGYDALLTNILAGALRNAYGQTGPGVPAIAGGCTTVSDPPNFLSGRVHDNLDERNVSWRAGVNFNLADDVLLYANASQGYKAGSFSALTAAEAFQFAPPTQEKLLGFETGFKSDLLQRTLRLNGALFYYDYTDKQIQGSVADPIFGALPKLINIPRSHVVGYEISALWAPISGMTMTPMVSYNRSRIDGNFSTINYLGTLQNMNGERFPDDASIQANIDAQYEWRLTGDVGAFVGANANYRGPFNASLGDLAAEHIGGYTLFDVRAGVTKGSTWRLQFWGRNVTDRFGVVNKLHVNDVYARWTVMPATYGLTLSYRFK